MADPSKEHQAAATHYRPTIQPPEGQPHPPAPYPRNAGEGGLGDARTTLEGEEPLVVPPPECSPATEETGLGPLQATEEALEGAAHWVKEKAGEAWGAVKPTLASGTHKAGEGLHTVTDKVSGALGLAAHKIADTLHQATSPGPVSAAAAQAFHAKEAEGKEEAAGVKSTVVGKADAAAEATKAKVGGVAADIQETAHATGARIQERAGAAKEGVLHGVEKTKEGVAAGVGKVQETGHAVKEGVVQGVETTKTSVGHGVGKVQAGGQAVKERVAYDAHTAKEVTRETVDEASRVMRESAQAVAGGVAGVAGKVTGWMEGMAGDVQHQKHGVGTAEQQQRGPVPSEEEMETLGGKVREEEDEEDVQSLAKEVATLDMT